MEKKPLYARFIGLWIALLAVAAVSFYLALLLRVAHHVASVVCLIVALACFGGLQIFQFSRLRFVRRLLKQQKRERAHRSGSTAPRGE